MTSAQEAQVVWYDTVKAQGNLSLLAPLKLQVRTWRCSSTTMTSFRPYAAQCLSQWAKYDIGLVVGDVDMYRVGNYWFTLIQGMRDMVH